MPDPPGSDKPPHQMPPMGEGPLSWGFAGLFILPLILILLVFVTTRCTNRGKEDLVVPSAEVDTVQPMQSEEN